MLSSDIDTLPTVHMHTYVTREGCEGSENDAHEGRNDSRGGDDEGGDAHLVRGAGYGGTISGGGVGPTHTGHGYTTFPSRSIACPAACTPAVVVGTTSCDLQWAVTE